MEIKTLPRKTVVRVKQAAPGNHGELAHRECSRSAVTISIHLVKQHLKAPPWCQALGWMGEDPARRLPWVYAGAHQGRLVLTRWSRFVFRRMAHFFKPQCFFWLWGKKKNEAEAQKAKKKAKIAE